MLYRGRLYDKNLLALASSESPSVWAWCTENIAILPVAGKCNFKCKLKSSSHVPKKIFLFASIIALQKRWKMLFTSS